HFEGTGNGLPELLLLQADAFSRLLDEIAQALDLPAEGVLSLPVCFQLLLDRLPIALREIRGEDVLFEQIDPISADARAEHFGQAGVDHLGEAAELLLDPLGLVD